MAAQPPDDFEEEEGERDSAYLNIHGAGPVQVEAQDQNPKDLEDCLVRKMTGDMDLSAEARDSGVGTARSSKRSQISEDDIQLSEDVRKMLGDKFMSYKTFDYYRTKYEQILPKPIKNGSFGTVYQAIALSDDNQCAVKKIKIKNGNYDDVGLSNPSKTDSEKILDFLRGCQEAVLQQGTFNRNNIVKVYESWLQYDTEQGREKPEKHLGTIAFYLYGSGANNKSGRTLNNMPEEVKEAFSELQDLCIYMVMDLYDGDLSDWLRGGNRETKDKEKIVYQLIDALSYVHSLGCSHADLHSGNILIKENNDGKGIQAAITDFGLCELCPKSGQGTRMKKDMMDFGDIVVEIFIPEAADCNILSTLINRGSLAEAGTLVRRYITNEDIVNIVVDCLNANAEQRATAQQLKERYVGDDDVAS